MPAVGSSVHPCRRASSIACLLHSSVRANDRKISTADPGFWVHSLIDPLLGEGVSIEPEVMEDCIRCFRDPKMVAGSCADSRSGMSIDLGHDEETFAAGQKVECPVLALWGANSFVGRGYEPLSVWG